jgi:hypothetical protein
MPPERRSGRGAANWRQLFWIATVGYQAVVGDGRVRIRHDNGPHTSSAAKGRPSDGGLAVATARKLRATERRENILRIRPGRSIRPGKTPAAEIFYRALLNGPISVANTSTSEFTSFEFADVLESGGPGISGQCQHIHNEALSCRS